MTPLNCTESELSTFLQALAEGYLPTSSLDTNPSAPSKSISIASKSYPSGKKTVSFHGFPSLEMSRSLTEGRGEDLSKPSVGDIHARASVMRHQGKTNQRKICHMNLSESSRKFSQTTFLARMFQGRRSKASVKTSAILVTMLDSDRLQRKTWGPIITALDGGYVHTPTCTANFAAQSMQKWPSCRNFVAIFGRPSPTSFEWLMGWPIGWSGLEPLAMDKFQSWLQQHGIFSNREHGALVDDRPRNNSCNPERVG